MIKFMPHPEIAMNYESYNPAIHKAVYAFDYAMLFGLMADGKLDKRGVYKYLLLNDLFFMVCFGMEIEKANHPFVVRQCDLVQKGAPTDTLDIWARYHWKSTIITIGETLQYHLNKPDHCTGILCYNRPAAKKPLRSIKRICESSDLLKWCFPDVLWQKPEVESPKWSEDDGLLFKRKSASRPQSTIEAWGLTEGMPTGSHYERLVFDDLETEDIRESQDMLNKVYNNFLMAHGNLGMGKDTDIVRVIGTYYSHFGPNVKIRDMKYESGENIYNLRLIPATHDGTREGIPVYMELKPFAKEKQGPHFNSQQLCDPTPSSEVRLNRDFLNPIEPQFIPKTIYKFLVLDQAGGDETNKQSRDLWSFGIVGIEPISDDIGQSNIYLMDVEADQMSHSEGINGIVTMYLRNGIIQQMGVEKVGLSTTEIHITNALRMKGRRLSLDSGNLVLLKPAGRSKVGRIEAALQWPLNNGKIFYSTAIPQKYIDAIKEEMQKFPFYHVDILDMLAYAYDMFKEFRFPARDDRSMGRTLKLASCPI